MGAIVIESREIYDRMALGFVKGEDMVTAEKDD